ncbi:unannotated protein [freshwater metagenome]|uniref:Unannotated protein n=1 Tax=freshwater metagenome TaxID=449393 RepID=A0A6J7ES65_9ZZZZ
MALGRSGDDAEVVAEPLHVRSCRQHDGLDAPGGLAVAAPCHDGERAMCGAVGVGWGVRPGAQVEHAAGAEGDLGLPGAYATLPHHRCLLIAGQAGDQRCAGQRAGNTVLANGVHDGGQHAHGNAQHIAGVGRPGAPCDVVQAGDRCVGVVGDVQGAAGHDPRHPGVDRAEQQVARTIGIVGVQQPGQLGGRLVRGQCHAVVCLGHDAVEHGAQILPAERRADRLAGAAVPHDG